MRRKNYKGQCIKKKLSKCKAVFRAYDDIQLFYADVLEANENVTEIISNVALEDTQLSEFTTDFVGTLYTGDYMVRECVFRKNLSRPHTLNRLDASRIYWLKRGVSDWGIVIDAEK